MCMLLESLGLLGGSHGNNINMCNQDTGITGIYNKYNMRVLLPCNNIFPAINGNMDMIVIR